MLQIGLKSEYEELKKDIRNLEFHDCKDFLEMAEIAGVEIPSNCTSGTCGTCLVKLRGGEVDLPEELPPGLDDELVELGGTLTCCIKPKGSCEIDVIPPAW